MSQSAKSFQVRRQTGGNVATVWLVDSFSELPVTGIVEGDIGIVVQDGLFYERLRNTSGWTLVFDPADLVGSVAAEDVVGLQAAVESFLADELAAKADLAHTHAQADITNLVSDLAGKAASSHTHAESDITNLVADLAGKAASVHTHAIGDTTGLQAALDGKAASSHQHNASDINAGTVATARLGSGTANGTTFLRGDQTWATPSAGSVAWGSVTGTLSSQTDLQTALDGKQAVDSDLTTIAGLTATTDSFMQAKSSAWAARTVAQVKTDLGLTGTNSGDQTSIVGISGTKAQFDTACSDGNFLYDYPALTSASSFATATTTISAATYADITGVSVTLAAGTWLIIGQVITGAANAIHQAFVAITDSANTVISETATSRPASGTASLNSPIGCTVTALVTHGGSTTYKLRAARGLTTHTGSYTVYDGNGVNTTNHATNNSDKGTGMFAVRIA